MQCFTKYERRYVHKRDPPRNSDMRFVCSR